MNTKQLIQDCKKQDRDAQKAFFMAYSAYSYGLILRYLGDEFRAKDVLQEVFIIVFRALQKFNYENEGKLKAWIKTITIRETLRNIRVQQSFVEKQEYSPEHDVIQDDYSVFAQMNTAELLNLLHQLPEGYRLVFNMYAIEGYSHAEIASALQISESTSRSQLTRARKMLQQLTLKLTRDAR